MLKGGGGGRGSFEVVLTREFEVLTILVDGGGGGSKNNDRSLGHFFWSLLGVKGHTIRNLGQDDIKIPFGF